MWLAMLSMQALRGQMNVNVQVALSGGAAATREADALADVGKVLDRFLASFTFS